MAQSESKSDRSAKSSNRSTPLHRDLTAYALAAGAAGVGVLSLNSAAVAEVVYTPANQTINAHQGYAIDLNQDGIVDFRIQNEFRTEIVRGRLYDQSFALLVSPADGVQVGNSQYEAAALPSGAQIGPIQPTKKFGARGAEMANQFAQGSFGTYYFGSWLNVQNQYLGLAFPLNGEMHYGWARLTVRWNRKWIISAHLTGYAYETVANKAIVAGDTGARGADAEAGPLREPVSESKGETIAPATLGLLALGAVSRDTAPSPR